MRVMDYTDIDLSKLPSFDCFVAINLVKYLGKANCYNKQSK